MRITNDANQYGAVAQALHWLIALLIFWAIVLGLITEELPNSPEKIQLFVLHKSAGITVLFLVVVRLVWRFISPSPPLDLAPKQEKLAHLGHWGLYALMISLPLSGWLMNSAAGYPFAWFNLVSVPHIPGVAKSSKELFSQLHGLLFYVIAAMIIGHVAMLLVHRFAHGQNLLPRMLPGKKAWPILLLVIIFAGLVGFTVKKANTAAANAEPSGAVAQAPSAMAEANITASGSVTKWQLVPTEDQFMFGSSYSGEDFDGAIQNFTPTIFFDPRSPAEGVIDVAIETKSITTFNEEWDGALTGSEWFATKEYATAHYYSDQISAQGDGFIAEGNLTLKGVTKPVAVKFHWQPEEGGNATFLGSAKIDRREFNIGTGSWANDDSIAFIVSLDIALLLQPAEQ